MPFTFLKNQVTDDDYIQFLRSWREENKPSVLLFDIAASAPFLYKVKCCFFVCPPPPMKSSPYSRYLSSLVFLTFIILQPSYKYHLPSTKLYLRHRIHVSDLLAGKNPVVWCCSVRSSPHSHIGTLCGSGT